MVVIRKIMKSWGRRRLDLKELYRLRYQKRLLLKEIMVLLDISKSTVITNLKKAEALYGRVDSEVV